MKKKKRFRVKVRHDYENEYEIGVQIMSKQVIKCVFQVRTLEARFHCNMNIEKSKVNRLVNRHISNETCFTIKSITYSSLCGPN